jgi:hypothetical protein
MQRALSLTSSTEKKGKKRNHEVNQSFMLRGRSKDRQGEGLVKAAQLEWWCGGCGWLEQDFHPGFFFPLAVWPVTSYFTSLHLRFSFTNCKQSFK